MMAPSRRATRQILPLKRQDLHLSAGTSCFSHLLAHVLFGSSRVRARPRSAACRFVLDM
jgi:hypothetical protein